MKETCVEYSERSLIIQWEKRIILPKAHNYVILLPVNTKSRDIIIIKKARSTPTKNSIEHNNRVRTRIGSREESQKIKKSNIMAAYYRQSVLRNLAMQIACSPRVNTTVPQDHFLSICLRMPSLDPHFRNQRRGSIEGTEAFVVAVMCLVARNLERRV